MGIAAKDTEDAYNQASDVASKEAKHAQAQGTYAKESAKKKAGSAYDSASKSASSGYTIHLPFTSIFEVQSFLCIFFILVVFGGNIYSAACYPILASVSQPSSSGSLWDIVRFLNAEVYVCIISFGLHGDTLT